MWVVVGVVVVCFMFGWLCSKKFLAIFRLFSVGVTAISSYYGMRRGRGGLYRVCGGW